MALRFAAGEFSKPEKMNYSGLAVHLCDRYLYPQLFDSTMVNNNNYPILNTRLYEGLTSKSGLSRLKTSFSK